MNKLRLWILLLLLGLQPHLTSLEALTIDDIPILPCEQNRPSKRSGEIALCALFRDEAPYLKEWIEYHRLVGVRHFYLYNNLSQDPYLEVLKPYIKAGVVELFEVPFESQIYNDGAATHNFVQVCCYNHAIKLAKGKNKWLAILDSDEFICPKKEENLSKTLKRFNKADGVVVYWQIFGTSGVWDLKPGELMIEKLLFRGPNSGPSGLFKSIVKPEGAVCIDPHWTQVNLLVQPDGQRFSHTPAFEEVPVDILSIHHYTYRTVSFYESVKKPRRALWGDEPDPLTEKNRLDSVNAIYDPSMLRFTEKLKKRL